METRPAQSADLNPIEHAWGELSRRMKYKQSLIHNVETLKEQLQSTWAELSFEFVQALYKSMPDRCRAVIAAKGNVTRY